MVCGRKALPEFWCLRLVSARLAALLSDPALLNTGKSGSDHIAVQARTQSVDEMQWPLLRLVPQTTAKTMGSTYAEIDAKRFRHTFFPGMKPMSSKQKAQIYSLELYSGDASLSDPSGVEPSAEMWRIERLVEDLTGSVADMLNLIFELAGSSARWKMVALNRSECDEQDNKSILALYPQDDEVKAAYTRNASQDCSDEHPEATRCVWSHMISVAEVQLFASDGDRVFSMASEADDDAECDTSFRKKLPTSKTARTQHSHSPAQIMLRQHRTHVFTVHISATAARVYRWDRAGCISTGPIHLVSAASDFFDILYCMARQDSYGWGQDPTVVRASKEEVALFKSFDPSNVHLQAHKDAIFKNTLLHPIYKVECEEISTEHGSSQRLPRSRAFLIGKSFSKHGKPLGRSTRGYIAFDLAARKVCFLKDQWRIQVDTPELEVYARLHRHNVEWIATPIAGGDVPGRLRKSFQTTRYHELAQASPKVRKSRVLVHTRLVTKEVGRPLDTYKSGSELLNVITFAVVAHQQAWKKAEVLHGDISTGNIMIDVATGRGFSLLDKLCCRCDN
ncbi:hypothetical protein PsYK624_026360 [Phanerochaete sordida]|uniref:Fungal-type protein kinase domain-containing protein n=1 Tax=Phanerochaete sordida TaxID=48140 RepID=A0A9P3G1J7_9APHY|nr:hypothetical protein PsYK624_026360 [Phanerochaete sordida]